MDEFTSLEGPVEAIEGKLVLRIPLAAGGNELIECSRGISEIVDDYLQIVIQDWLAKKLLLEAGCHVTISNKDGKFNIQRSDLIIQ